MSFQNVTGKLGSMRKSVDWVVYPHVAGCDHWVIQSDRRIALVKRDGSGAVLSAGRSGGAYNVHLSPALGATTVGVPETILEQLKALPATGETVTLIG